MTADHEVAHAKLPLADIRVLDIATMGAAPLAGTFLGDFGADVIKVEHPESGDHIRAYGMKKGDVSLYWKTISRNKRTITLNLKHEDGQRILKQLVKTADVVIENFRPGTLESWNIGYGDLTTSMISLARFDNATATVCLMLRRGGRMKVASQANMLRCQAARSRLQCGC